MLALNYYLRGWCIRYTKRQVIEFQPSNLAEQRGSIARAGEGQMRLLGCGVRCVRGGREVFSGLDFETPSGEALAVTGPNGAGKTSLLRLIAGLLTMSDGSIRLEGGESELPLPEQAHYLGHRDALKPALSVMENLAFWRDFLGGEADDAGASLAAVGLDHAAHLPAAYLSAGQRRRLRRSPGCWRSGGRSGCWMSRPMRSTWPDRACSPP